MLILIRASFLPVIVQVFRKNLDSDDHFDRPFSFMAVKGNRPTNHRTKERKK